MLLLLALIAALVCARWAARAWRNEPRQRYLRLIPVAGCVIAAIAAAPEPMVLTKCAGALAMPIGMVWTALAVTAAVAWWRGKIAHFAALSAIWVGLTLAASPPLATLAAQYVEGENAHRSPLHAGSFDLVIVLGGGTNDTPQSEVQLGDAGDRLVLGARLWHLGRTTLLATSGDPYPGVTSHDAGLATQRIWMQLGVPESAIVRVRGARNTSEEAHLHTRNVREHHYARVGLITSAMHMGRALARFHDEGLDPTPLPADVRGGEVHWRGIYSILPQASSATALQAAMWEIVGRSLGR
jgi:uncharacterized SAM-binding protein YcdF (DUF218 family)